MGLRGGGNVSLFEIYRFPGGLSLEDEAKVWIRAERQKAAPDPCVPLRASYRMETPGRHDPARQSRLKVTI